MDQAQNQLVASVLTISDNLCAMFPTLVRPLLEQHVRRRLQNMLETGIGPDEATNVVMDACVDDALRDLNILMAEEDAEVFEEVVEEEPRDDRFRRAPRRDGHRDSFSDSDDSEPPRRMDVRDFQFDSADEDDHILGEETTQNTEEEINDDILDTDSLDLNSLSSRASSPVISQRMTAMTTPATGQVTSPATQAVTPAPSSASGFTLTMDSATPVPSSSASDSSLPTFRVSPPVDVTSQNSNSSDSWLHSEKSSGHSLSSTPEDSIKAETTCNAVSGSATNDKVSDSLDGNVSRTAESASNGVKASIVEDVSGSEPMVVEEYRDPAPVKDDDSNSPHKILDIADLEQERDRGLLIKEAKLKLAGPASNAPSVVRTEGLKMVVSPARLPGPAKSDSGLLSPARLKLPQKSSGPPRSGGVLDWLTPVKESIPGQLDDLDHAVIFAKKAAYYADKARKSLPGTPESKKPPRIKCKHTKPRILYKSDDKLKDMFGFPFYIKDSFMNILEWETNTVKRSVIDKIKRMYPYGDPERPCNWVEMIQALTHSLATHTDRFSYCVHFEKIMNSSAVGEVPDEYRDKPVESAPRSAFRVSRPIELFDDDLPELTTPVRKRFKSADGSSRGCVDLTKSPEPQGEGDSKAPIVNLIRDTDDAWKVKSHDQNQNLKTKERGRGDEPREVDISILLDSDGEEWQVASPAKIAAQKAERLLLTTTMKKKSVELRTLQKKPGVPARTLSKINPADLVRGSSAPLNPAATSFKPYRKDEGAEFDVFLQKFLKDKIDADRDTGRPIDPLLHSFAEPVPQRPVEKVVRSLVKPVPQRHAPEPAQAEPQRPVPVPAPAAPAAPRPPPAAVAAPAPAAAPADPVQAAAAGHAPAEPPPGPAEPQPRPAEPQPGPAEPQPGPAEPQPGPAEPQPGPAPRDDNQFPAAAVVTTAEKMKNVLELFPDAEQEHIREKLTNLGGSVQLVIEDFLTNSYKKRETVTVQDDSDSETENQQVVAGNEDYESLMKEDVNCYDYEYRRAVEAQLTQEFKRVSMKDIRLVRAKFPRYLHARRILIDSLDAANLLDVAKRMKTYDDPGSTDYNLRIPVGDIASTEVRTVAGKLLQCGRNSSGSGLHSDLLDRELRYLASKQKKDEEKQDAEMAQRMNEEEYADQNALIECACCYNEVVFESMVQCSEGHLFCKDCLVRYTQEAISGHGKSTLVCMDGCGAVFTRPMLKQNLDPKIFKLYENRVQEEVVNLAGLSNLYSCPKCNFKMVMEDDANRVFECKNPTCMKKTCRDCKVDWNEHIGKKCKEVEDQNETSIRKKYEEELTNATLRQCIRCRAEFVKSDGCNKMTCRCGNKMCYICRAPGIDYDHFCKHLREPGHGCKKCNACSLWTNPEQDDERAREEIRQRGKEERKERGFEEEKLIGAPVEAEPAQNAPRPAVQNARAEIIQVIRQARAAVPNNPAVNPAVGRVFQEAHAAIAALANPAVHGAGALHQQARLQVQPLMNVPVPPVAAPPAPAPAPPREAPPAPREAPRQGHHHAPYDRPRHAQHGPQRHRHQHRHHQHHQAHRRHGGPGHYDVNYDGGNRGWDAPNNRDLRGMPWHHDRR